MATVTSRRHPLVSRYRALARNRDVDSHDILLDGPHLVRDALAAGCRIQHAAITTNARAKDEGADLARALTAANVELISVAGDVMDAMSPVKQPWGLVAIAERPASDPHRAFARAPQLIVIAIDVQDPGNVGAMIRAAEAGGATAFVAAGTTADPFGWKALRGSMGSALRVPIVRDEALAAIDRARRLGVRIVAATPRDGTALDRAAVGGPVAFVLGSEGQGLPDSVRERADELITIPMAAPVESLNVAVTTALVVYEAFRQRRDNGRRA